jgi:hypothetical protein
VLEIPRGRVKVAGQAVPVLPPAAELAIAVVFVWLALVAMILIHGGIGISWDALNHQVYLGWSADAARFDRDVMPAAYQTYQFPYLYWPLYRLALGNFSGMQAGIVLVSLQMITVPPAWIVARSCMPEASWFGTAMRLMGVGLAFLSGLVLSLFTSTSNDLLAAAPLLWAIAAVFPYAARSDAQRLPYGAVVLSGALGGLSVACKLSNGPLVLLLPLLWVTPPQGWRRRVAAGIFGSIAIVLAFALAYGTWGIQLWKLHGNPIYPFADAWFAHLRTALGWAP